MEKVFWTSPYLTELEAIVQTVKDNEITVNRTIFYALSGGQESDAGTIGGYNVIQDSPNSKKKPTLLSVPTTISLASSPMSATAGGTGRSRTLRRFLAEERICIERAKSASSN